MAFAQPKMLQYPAEIERLRDIVVTEGVTRYLEIGCKHGGVTWFLGSAMPPGSRIVAVDLPAGKAATEAERSLTQTVKELRAQNYDTHLLWGDSRATSTIEAVMALAPFDLIFIDANHTLPYVTADWETYGPLGRIVAFHDIGWWRPEGTPLGYYPIEVPVFWKRVRQDYRHEEITLDRTGQDNGIGVLWREERP